MKLTAKEILDKLSEWEEVNVDEADERGIPEMSESLFAHCDMPNPLPEGVGKWKEMEKHGGKGEGNEWHSVKYFIEHDIYIKTTGFYQSHHGTDFDYGYGEEVKPVEKKVTVFE